MAANTRILDAREARAAYQHDLLAEHGGTLITVKANYPGANKITAESMFVVAEIAAHIQQRFPVEEQQRVISVEGMIVYFSCLADGKTVKEQMIALEEEHALGRLADIDVMDIHQSYGRKTPRSCYLCDQPAHACARSQAHEQEDIIRYFNQVVTTYQENR